MSIRYNRSGKVPGSHTETQIARREAAMKQIRELLVDEPMSSRTLAAQMDMNSATVYGYLRQLEDEGYVCKTGHQDARGRQTWMPDDAPKKQAGEHARRAFVAPARQVGMQRHWMDVALFGPAPAAQQ
jgi:DNA-binding transcriptional regulator YhcF (GntR family)